MGKHMTISIKKENKDVLEERLSKHIYAVQFLNSDDMK